MQNRKLILAGLAAVLVATAVAYLPSIDGEFQYDDQEIAKTTWVREHGEFFNPGFWIDLVRPVTSYTFALDHAIDQFRPRAWHATSVAIHLGVVVLAWLFARRVFARAGLSPGGIAPAPDAEPAPEKGKGKRGKGKLDEAAPRPARIPEWPALAAAALFALHPLHTEAVSYISQRSEALASGFYLAALLALVAYDEAQGARRTKLLVAGYALHVLALGAKPIAATMPAAWLLLAATVPVAAERGVPWTERVLRRVPASLPLFAASAIQAFTNIQGVQGSGHAGFDLPFATPLEYLATQMRVLPTYLRLLFFPVGLNADWQFPFSHSLLEPAVLGGVAILGGISGLILVARHRFGHAEGDLGTVARLAGFGWLFYLCVLAPTTIVPLRDPFVEHRSYLAALGIVLAVVAGAVVGARQLAGAARARAAGWALGAVAIAAAAALAIGTYVRNEVWSSALALWSDASQKAPGKPRIWVNLGTALHFAGRYDQAVVAYDRALALGFDPTVPLELVVRNTALALIRLRRYDEARQRLVDYLQRAPGDAGTIVILALVEADTNRLDQAERAARQALAIDPRASRPYQILGQVSEKRGDLQGAYDAFATANRVDPADPLPVYSMGRVEEKRGRIPQACELYARATDALARSSAARSAAEAYRRLCAR